MYDFIHISMYIFFPEASIYSTLKVPLLIFLYFGLYIRDVVLRLPIISIIELILDKSLLEIIQK